ncbi:hypothetical protein TUN199_05601 [Pyrenophora tritici-repentis]|nr:hypothetical protein Alg130_05474 [Pyrenophora tritici-repentis]KAI0610428.1 hypothetical protein TUN205_05356 [Pyrenophora tritici-repentis]KAI0622439.1 hypothetical protein TUN199_05601 [Pyrenophora tritici-repentis]
MKSTQILAAIALLASSSFAQNCGYHDKGNCPGNEIIITCAPPAEPPTPCSTIFQKVAAVIGMVWSGLV